MSERDLDRVTDQALDPDLVAGILFKSFDELHDIAENLKLIDSKTWVKNGRSQVEISEDEYQALSVQEKNVGWRTKDERAMRDVAFRFGIETSNKKACLQHIVLSSIPLAAVKEYFDLRQAQHSVLSRFKNLDKLTPQMVVDLRTTIRETPGILSSVPMKLWNVAQQCVYHGDADMLKFVLSVESSVSLSYRSKDGRDVASMVEEFATNREDMKEILKSFRKRKIDASEEGTQACKVAKKSPKDKAAEAFAIMNP